MADEEALLSAFFPNEARLAEGDPDAEGESSTRLLRLVGLSMGAGAGDCSKYAPKPGELSREAEPENEGEGAIVGLRCSGAGESRYIDEDGNFAVFGDGEASFDSMVFSLSSLNADQPSGRGDRVLDILRSGTAGGGISFDPKVARGGRPRLNVCTSAVNARLGRANEGIGPCDCRLLCKGERAGLRGTTLDRGAGEEGDR